MKTHHAFLAVLLIALSATSHLWAQSATEDDYYPITTFELPLEETIEACGFQMMDDGKLAVCSRRGDIFLVSEPLSKEVKSNQFSVYARGLHEPLSLALKDGWLYATQRPEVTRMRDEDGDGRADVFETHADGWGISGDYHEYAFGSKFDANGDMIITLCLTGSFSSKVPYRGWGSVGPRPFAVERIDWSGKIPFEIKAMRLTHDGFELEFTQPASTSASDTSSYKLTTYTYEYRSQYGSPEVDHTEPTIQSATLSEDGRKVRLIVDGLQLGHVHELHAPGVRNSQDQPLLHSQAYYTLNRMHGDAKP